MCMRVGTATQHTHDTEPMTAMFDAPATADSASTVDAAERERARLVRLCAWLTRDPAVAEDLAQETLLEAWRQAHKLVDPRGRERWLAAIAHNVCRRWARRVWRERAPRQPVAAESERGELDDPAQLFEARECDESLRLALASPPPLTRHAVLERHLDGRPLAEIGARLGISEDAVAMRLTRGRRALRQALTERPAAAEPASGPPSDAAWRPTRVWCPECGAARLVMRRRQADDATLAFRCPNCQRDPESIATEFRLHNAGFARLLGGLTQPRAILNRAAVWSHAYYQAALEHGVAPCTHCGQPAPLRQTTSVERAADLPPHPLFVVECGLCGEGSSTSLGGLLLSLPPVQRFWREQARIRALPRLAVQAHGQTALVARFESVSGPARLELVVAAANLALLSSQATSA